MSQLDESCILGLKRYFLPRTAESNGSPLAYLLLKSMRVLSIMCMIGLCIAFLNLGSVNLYEEHDGCPDDLLRATSATVATKPMYQWLYSTLNCILIGLVILLTRQLKTSIRVARAEKIHDCLLFFTQTPAHDEHRCYITRWAERARNWNKPQEEGASVWRVLAVGLLHVPLLFLVALPSGSYVLAQNLPATSS